MKRSVFFAISFFAAGAQASPLYSLTDLGTLGGSASYGYGVNDAGQVTGYSQLTGTSSVHAFRYTPGGGGLSDLGTYGGASSYGYGINLSGQTVVDSTTSSGGNAVRYTDGTGYQDLGNLGRVDSTARAINDAGQVAGWSQTSSANTHAFLYTDGVGIQDLGTLGGTFSQGYDINASGQVVGYSTAANGQSHAFRYTSGSGMFDLGTLTNGSTSYAYGINGSGMVTGYYRTAGGSYHVYLYKDGDTALSDLGGLSGMAFDVGTSVNDSGSVVGWAGNSTEPVKAFLYTQSGGMSDLTSLLDASGAGWTLTYASSISNSGYITGYGVNALGRTHAYLLSPVPEPASFLALAIGAAGFVGRRDATKKKRGR